VRQHGPSRAASDLKNGAPARSAAVLPYVPTHAGRRRRSSPVRAILPVSVGGAHSDHFRGSITSSSGRGSTTSSFGPSFPRPTTFTTAEPASSRPVSLRAAAAADAAAQPIPSRPGSPGQVAGTVPAAKPAPPSPALFRLAAAAAAAAEPASSRPASP